MLSGGDMHINMLSAIIKCTGIKSLFSLTGPGEQRENIKRLLERRGLPESVLDTNSTQQESIETTCLAELLKKSCHST